MCVTFVSFYIIRDYAYQNFALKAIQLKALFRIELLYTCLKIAFNSH